MFAATPTQIKEAPGIELNDINKMEHSWYQLQFYVDKETYVHWVGFLKGLVITKERGIQQWQ
jgi:hypothetical protein